MVTQDPVDVLICGSGSAGLCAAVWLARCGISYRILEKRPGQLRHGQADGVQCRTVEMFESFGISEDLLKEAYHVLEVAFWSAPEEGGEAGEGGADDKDGKKGQNPDRPGIRRTHFAPDMERGLSHQPHVILNQARMNDLMVKEIERSAGRIDISYGVEVQGVQVDEPGADADGYGVTTSAVDGDGKPLTFRSKYVLACDGAHSAVRRSLGFKMLGDSTDSIWGVVDLYPRTDFPDIRKKSVLHSSSPSSSSGNLMIIPREGDAMVRFYIELGSDAPVGDVTLDALEAKARDIFFPYEIDFAETVWWSAYAIGQRLADNFHLRRRVFLTGDACHTHSPKAGQGMNVSLQDGYNVGWKLAAAIKGRVRADDVLETYVSERRQTAADLIEFDRMFTRLFSSAHRAEHGITAEYFKDQFVKAGRYTAGQGTKYGPSVLVSPLPRSDSAASASASTSAAANLVVGMRFPSALVVRFSDARAMQLVRALPADSRWHVLAFAGDILDDERSRTVAKVSQQLQNIADTFTPADQDVDSVIQGLLVLTSERAKVGVEHVPPFFTPVTGRHRIKCLHRVFVDGEGWNSDHGHAYEKYGIDAARGALVVVRPDQYISLICGLEDTERVSEFFHGFMIPSK